MAEGVTAYVNGEKITGIVPVITTNDCANIEYKTIEKMGQLVFDAIGTCTDDMLVRQGADVSMTVPREVFGDATVSDVLADKTFTCSNGIKLKGTISSQSAKTITPTKSTQTAIPAKTYAAGAVTVAAIPSKYIETSDATAVAADIAKDKTAYVNGVKITGTHECSGGDTVVTQTYYVSNVAPSASLGNDGDLCLVRAGE